ncbi:hypothetical protein pipiens_020368, partial [Culex pipiens pipiens]
SWKGRKEKYNCICRQCACVPRVLLIGHNLCFNLFSK